MGLGACARPPRGDKVTPSGLTGREAKPEKEAVTDTGPSSLELPCEQLQHRCGGTRYALEAC